MNNLYLNVHVVIFSLCDNAVQVLLAPGEKDGWHLPRKDVRAEESLETAAVGAFAGQLGQGEAYMEQLYTYGDPGRTPGQRTASVVYFALIPSDAQRTTSTGKMRWFRLNELLALAHDHDEIIRYALRRLHYKMEYSTAGFELLPDEFTLSELQHTYEIILGEKLDKRNFRPPSGDGRPVSLYRYRADAVAEVKARRLFP